MKRILATSALLLLALSACSSNEEASTTLSGTWKKAEGEAFVCRNSFAFEGEKTVTIEESRAQGGQTETVEYEHLEGNRYNFGPDLYVIDVKDDNTMEVQFHGNGDICKYNKEK